MKKLMKISIVISLILVILIGGYIAYEKKNEDISKKKVIELIESKEYDKAIIKINEILKKEPRNNEFSDEKSNLEAYLSAKDEFNKGDYSESNLLISKITNEENKSIKEDIDSLKKELIPKLKVENKFNADVENINNIILNKDFKGATSKVNDLEKGNLTSFQKDKILVLKDKIKKGLYEEKRYEEMKKKAEEKKKLKGDELTANEAISKVGKVKNVKKAADSGARIIYTPTKDTVNGKSGYKVDVSENREEKVNNLGNYFVDNEGKIYELDIISNKYVLVK